MKPPVLVVIIGPTAVGKTEVGIELAKLMQGEVISGDSMQVYREMDIGTAKPTLEEMQGIPHRMIDILNPDQEFSVALFQKMVEEYITEITGQGHLPILVGGTGLYIRSVIDHYDFTPVAVDSELRERLNKEVAEQGQDRLYQRLREVDPAAADRIHPNDIRRTIRALEVFYNCGVPISEYQKANDQELPPKYTLGYFGLNMDRKNLYIRIEQRVDIMIEKGLVGEVEMLMGKGYSEQLISMQGIGYKEIIGHVHGEYSIEEAVELIKRNTRRFAKRQLTWFRRDPRITWVDVESYANKSEIAREIATRLEGQLITT